MVLKYPAQTTVETFGVISRPTRTLKFRAANLWKVITAAFTASVLLLAASYALAGEADVVDVYVSKTSPRTFAFDVTVRHADSGWDHYADKWEVLDVDGNALGVRVLYHPHVGEQPFTRSLSGVQIPAGVKQVTIRAHDKVHEWGGKTVTIELP